jgi:uncharacterized repeat protein (TIGR03803 family)
MAVSPQGSLIQASNGKLYGMTVVGGSLGVGVIFSFDPLTSTYSKEMDFDKSIGGVPHGSLIQASDGKLYGMTEAGGTKDRGVIFSFDPSTSIYTKLLDFDNINGAAPLGSLIQASDGKLYGMTNRGGINDKGVIFSIDPSTSAFARLKDLDVTNGSSPVGSLMQATDGKLYGMTYDGGSFGYGVIFSYNPLAASYSNLHDFVYTDGANPQGNLMQSVNGKLYGMTNSGGSAYAGVIVFFDPATSTYTKLKDFEGINGAKPYLGSVFIEVNECNADTTYYQDADRDGFGNPNDSIKACTQPAGYVTNNKDCDDTKSSVHPGAQEICGNGIDDNCNGQVDEGCNNMPAARINDVTVDEPKGVAILTVRLSKKATRPVWILYYTKDGTAISRGTHKDYVAKVGLLRISPGANTGTISIKIIKDNIPEPPEYLDIVLIKSYNATIGDGRARVFITDTIPSSRPKFETVQKKEKPVNSLAISAMPNPTSSQFKLIVESSNRKGEINLVVLDVQGRLIESRSKLAPGAGDFDWQRLQAWLLFYTGDPG